MSKYYDENMITGDYTEDLGEITPLFLNQWVDDATPPEVETVSINDLEPELGQYFG